MIHPVHEETLAPILQETIQERFSCRICPEHITRLFLHQINTSYKCSLENLRN